VRTLIVFYSRTGNTRKAAEALAAQIGGELAEIRCARYGPGFLSYLMAGFDSLTGRVPAIAATPQNASTYDLVVIGGPIWTDHPALPIRAFLAGNPKLPDKVALLVTRDRVPPEPAFAEMQAMLRKPVVAKLALTAGNIHHGKIAEQVRGFADQLRAAVDAPGRVLAEP
jgi:hypothetical protein